MKAFGFNVVGWLLVVFGFYLIAGSLGILPTIGVFLVIFGCNMWGSK